MAQTLNIRNLQIGLAVCATFAAAAIIQTGAQRFSNYFTQRDNQTLGNVIGPHHVQGNQISDAFARQLGQAVFPRITDGHLKLNSTASSMFFVKQGEGQEDLLVAMSTTHHNQEGTYFIVRDGMKVTTYDCRGRAQLYVDVSPTFPRNKAHVADLSSNCRDIESPRHIEFNRNAYSAANRIPNALRDEIVLSLKAEQLYSSDAISVEVSSGSYTIRRNTADYFTHKRRPHVFIRGTTYECELALSASSVGHYRDQMERHPHPVLTVYDCMKTRTANLQP